MGNKYAYEDVLKTSTEYFNGDELAGKVVVDKYLLQDDDGNFLESGPEQLLERIISEILRIDNKKFKTPFTKELLKEKINFNTIVPQGSLLFGIGNKQQYVSLSNCLTLPPVIDSYAGICYTDQQLVQASKRRAGVGFDISGLRPAGSSTSNSSKTSTGIVPFMERFSNSIREVGQNNRRGALALTIDVRHPQIFDFINAKKDLTKITGANLSIRINNDFMEAVKNNDCFILQWPVDSNEPKITQKIQAKYLWDCIIKSARNTAEPGILMWSNAQSESISDCYEGYEIVGINPCAEQFLASFSVCRLILINLFMYVKNPFTDIASFDYARLYEDSKIMQRIIDNVVDLEIECIDRIINKIKKDKEKENIKILELELWENIKDVCIQERRSGCGATGLADSLAGLGYKYDSDIGIQTIDRIYKTLKFGCYVSSVEMSKELGFFPIWNFNKEKNNPFLNRIKEETIELNYDGKIVIIKGSDIYKDIKQYGRRNIALLTSSPSGSLSILTQTSSGIEPVFQLSYRRRRKLNDTKNKNIDFVDKNGDSWQEYDVLHPRLRQWMEMNPQKDMSESPWAGCCAHEINWMKRIEVQQNIQKHIDSSISSTINLPNDVTEDEVSKIYFEAWKRNLKGVTIYREGSRDGVLLSSTPKKENNIINKTNAPKRPTSLPCDIYQPIVKGETYLIIVGLLGNEPYEVFALRESSVSKSIKEGILTKIKRMHYSLLLKDGETVIIQNIMENSSEMEEAITRLTSAALRHGADISFIVHQLEKSKGDFMSFEKAISRSLKKYIKNGSTVKGEECFICGSNLFREDGCIICKNCGWTKCS